MVAAAAVLAPPLAAAASGGCGGERLDAAVHGIAGAFRLQNITEAVAVIVSSSKSGKDVLLPLLPGLSYKKPVSCVLLQATP